LIRFFSLTYIHIEKMDCPICLNETDDMYTIACGSNTPHQICNACEISMRCSANPTNHGRFIKCPLCRVVETVQGARTIESYKAELQRMYTPQAPLQAPRRHSCQQMEWCQNGIIVLLIFLICFI